ncbi:MAG: tyrosine-type recombinase/integrase [Christensenellales bacterium]|jgi:integrase
MKKQADGRYRVRVNVGRDAEGKIIYKYASGRTKKEVEQKKEELLKHYVGGRKIERDVLFEVYAERWVTTYKLGKKSAGTDQNYKTALYHHLIPAFKNRQLRAITSFDLQEFMNSMAGKGRSTIGYIHSVIRNVFEKAFAEGVIDRNPVLGLEKPRSEYKKRRALTDNEIAATLKVGETHRDGLFLLMLYYTGLRRGEAVGLQWQDIDFRRQTLSVRRDYDFKTGTIGKLKSQASERTIPLPVELCEMLHAVRGIGEAFVFDRIMNAPMTKLEAYKDTWESLRKALYAADNTIEAIGKGANRRSILTAHYYRHNYASILYNAGIDVLTAQKWMGHADAKTTLSIYSHLSEDYELRNAGKLNDAFKKIVAKRLPEEGK